MIRNDLQSRTIDAMRLVLIVGVVLVHAYTATRADIDTGQYPVYRFVSFLLSLSIAQIAIPGFFFLSGYLYFHTYRTYSQRMRHEWRRLIIPYIFWNILMLTLYWILEHIPAFCGLFSGDNLPISQFSAKDLLRAFWDSGHWDHGNGTPILHQFWYIRNLLLLGLISPLIRCYVRWTGLVGCALLVAWWIFAPGQALIAKSLAFFTFGAWFSTKEQNFLPIFNKYSRPSIITFIILLVLTMWFWDSPWSVWINRLNDLFGLMIAIVITSWVLTRNKQTQSLAHLQGLTFFIYAAHDPLIIVVKRVMLRMAAPTDAWITAVYFISTILVITICTISYYLIKRFLPPLMSLMVGARSIKKQHI